MAEKVCTISLKVPAGKVTPAPAIASALGQRGVNLMKFCKECSDKTAEGFEPGEEIFVAVNIFANKSFDIVVKGASVANMIFKAAGVAKGSSSPGKQVAAKLPLSAVVEIAKKKLHLMNAYDLDQAIKMVRGTALSCGITVVED